MTVKELIKQLSTCGPDDVVLMSVDEEDGVKSIERCQLVATHRDPTNISGAVGIIQLAGDSYYHSVDNAIENIF